MVDLNGVWLPVARELGGALCDEQVRPELLRLRVRPRGEILS